MGNVAGSSVGSVPFGCVSFQAHHNLSRLDHEASRNEGPHKCKSGSALSISDLAALFAGSVVLEVTCDVSTTSLEETLPILLAERAGASGYDRVCTVAFRRQHVPLQ